MFRCKIVVALFSLFPFKFWQGFLIRSHIQKCERCTNRVASRDEIKALMIQQEDVVDFRDLWPAVKAGILEKEWGKRAGASFHRRWVFAAACFVAVCLAGVFIFHLLPKNGILSEQDGETGFRINSIRVGEEPATPFVYQSKDSDMILVWAEKS